MIKGIIKDKYENIFEYTKTATMTKITIKQLNHINTDIINEILERKSTNEKK